MWAFDIDGVHQTNLKYFLINVFIEKRRLTLRTCRTLF